MIINCRNWIAGKFRGDEFPIQDKTSVNLFMDAIHGRKRQRLLDPGQLVSAALQATEGGDGSLFRIDWNAGGVANAYRNSTHSHWLCGYTCCIGLDTYYYFCSGLVDICGRRVGCPVWDRRSRHYLLNDTLRLIDMCIRWGSLAQGVDIPVHIDRLQDLYGAHPLWIFGAREIIRDTRMYHEVFMYASAYNEEVFACPQPDTTDSTPSPVCESTDSDVSTATESGTISSPADETNVAG